MAATTPSAVGESSKIKVEIPYAEIADLRKKLSNEQQEVIVRVGRRDGKGRFAMIPTGAQILKTLDDLAAPETWLYELAGGGNFQLDVFDPEDLVTRLLAFRVVVEGREKTPRGSGERGAGVRRVPAYDAGPSYPSAGAGGGGDTDDPETVHLYDRQARQQYLDLRRDVERVTKLNEELRAQIERERRAADERLNRERDERRRLEAEAEKREHQQQLESLRAEIARMGERRNEPAAPAIDWPKTLAALVPMGTAFVTMLGSAKDRDLKQFEVMLGALGKREDGSSTVVKLLTDTVLPLVQNAGNSRSPEGLAHLIEAMADMQSTSMAQFTQMLRDSAQDQPDNPWIPMVERGLHALGEIAQQMKETVSEGVRGPRQELPRDERNPSPEQIADAIVRHKNFPEDMRKPAWRKFLTRIHAREDVDKLAADLAGYLEDQSQTNDLPQMFAELFTSDDPASDFLAGLLEHLPIQQMDPAYVRRLLVAFDDRLPPPEEDEVEAEVITTPPPQETDQGA